MASKNWQWVVEAWFEFDDPLDQEDYAERKRRGEMNAGHLVEWTILTEKQFLELGGKIDGFNEMNGHRRRLRRRQKNKRSVRKRPMPPTMDWTYANRAMKPRLIHECLPVIIKAQRVEHVLIKPYREHTPHWRLRNVNTKEIIPGMMLVE